MSDNKNNNLIEEINNTLNKRKRPRRSNKKEKDLSRLEKVSNEKRKSIDNILDMIGATNGITFVSNGERNGDNPVSDKDFSDIIKNILKSSSSNNENNKKQASTTPPSKTGNAFESVLEELFSESPLSDDNEEEENYDEEESNIDSVFRLLLDDEGVDMCPPVESILKYLTQTRPFGIDWEVEKVAKFLKDNGYTIYKKKNSDGEFMVAYKEGVTGSVEKMNKTNLGEEFSSVVQDILLNWLFRIK